MTTDLVLHSDPVYSAASLSERKEYARALAAAGSLLPKGLMERNERGQDVPSPGKILLVAETGNMLGIHPVAAIQGVNIIEGKPTLAPALMSALVRGAGHVLDVKVLGTKTGGDLRVRTVLTRRDSGSKYEATWTMEDAVDAGLCTYTLDEKTQRWVVRAQSGSGKPLPWQAYTRAMLMHRAISEVCRMGAEDVLMGIHYVPEELGALVNEAGEVIDGEIVEDEPGPRNNGKRGHASETGLSSRPDAEPTRTGANRPSPSRPVTSPGTGRASAPDEPSEETAAAVANYLELIAAEDNIERLRDLHSDASTHGLLATPTGDGRRLNDVFYQRREAILQAQEMPPALDGIEDDA